jgi:hypothetical protein
MSGWKNAFAMERAADFAPSERERELIDKFAQRICRHGLALPAILFLETARPLNFIGAQTMVFFEPIVRGIFDWPSYDAFAKMLERRGSVEAIIAAIEAIEADQQRRVNKWKAEHPRGRGFFGRFRRQKSTVGEEKSDEH